MTRSLMGVLTMMVFGATSTLTHDAEACSVVQPSPSSTIVADDVPDCIGLTTQDRSVSELIIDNQCEDSFTLKVVDCADCSFEELEVPAGAQVQVRLGTNTSDATIAQSFSWTSGTQMGTIDIEIEPPADLGPNPCGSGCFVSVAPVPQTPPSPWALGSFMIALAWLGRRTASRPRQ